jgi:hypothetical protein
MRPEVLLILAAFGLWFLLKRDWEGVVLLLLSAVVIAVAWFVTPWLVGGDPFNTLNISKTVPPFAKAYTVLKNLTMPASGGLWPPRLLIVPLAAAGLLALWRKRDRSLEILVGSTAVFAVVGVATLVSGSAGMPRYFLVCSVSACCLVGPGAMLLINKIPSAKAATAAFVIACCLLVASVPLPGFPLAQSREPIPGIAAADSLDAGAEALRLAISRRDNLNCPGVPIAIATDYRSWPHLAARTGHPMGDFNYMATAPVITVEQNPSGTPAARPSRFVVVSGRTGNPQVLARLTGGDTTWTVKYFPGPNGCGLPAQQRGKTD